jgi:DHA1 family inner membrane transport protein
VPAMAMMTGAVDARDRGGFMSINSSVQQFSMGLTSLLGGIILGQGANGEMTRFPLNGLLSLACALGCIHLAKFLKSPPKKEMAAEPVLIEG